jgi:tripartite-type tricarboxylate transporter receptor subunit TctC
VLSGQVVMTIGSPSATKAHVAAGRLRAIAVTGSERIPALPEVPTFVELGLKGVDAGSYWVSLAPAGTPQAAIRTLSAAIGRTVQAPDVKPRLVDLGFTPIGSTPEECAANIRGEIEKWARVVKAARIRIE